MVLRRWLSNPSPGLDSALRAYRKLELFPDSPDLQRPRPTIKTFRHLTVRDIEQAIAAYEAGANLDQVATQFGVHRHTISDHLKAAGVQLRFAALTPSQIQEAIDLYKQGWSFARIGEHLGKNPSGICRAFKIAGIPRRDTHGRVR